VITLHRLSCVVVLPGDRPLLKFLPAKPEVSGIAGFFVLATRPGCGPNGIGGCFRAARVRATRRRTTVSGAAQGGFYRARQNSSEPKATTARSALSSRVRLSTHKTTPDETLEVSNNESN
jgi:hypothetical protein